MLNDPEKSIESIREHGFNYENRKGIQSFDFIDEQEEIRWDVQQLHDVLSVARQIGGPNHNFRFL